MNRKMAYYWCTYLQMIAPLKVSRMLADCRQPQDIFRLSEKQLTEGYRLSERELQIFLQAKRMETRLTGELERLQDMQIRFISKEEEEYPGRLRELPDCPCGLFVKGRLPPAGTCCVAVVGARACSSYGQECADQIASVLASYGIGIVSGMAYGVDAYAHRAAMKLGTSYAVLGGGVNLCYPREHQKLYEQLIETGGVVSEMQPDTPGKPSLFPRRNRIISGMCDAVVVVEARKRSGSLITADFAAEQGRLVYAVPGSIRSGLSEGCHQLIRNGATLLHKPEDVLEDLLHMTVKESRNTIGKQPLTAQEADIYQLAGKETVTQEELLAKSAYPAGTLAEVLLNLELKGYLNQICTNRYRITALRPPSFFRQKE